MSIRIDCEIIIEILLNLSINIFLFTLRNKTKYGKITNKPTSVKRMKELREVVLILFGDYLHCLKN